MTTLARTLGHIGRADHNPDSGEHVEAITEAFLGRWHLTLHLRPAFAFGVDIDDLGDDESPAPQISFFFGPFRIIAALDFCIAPGCDEGAGHSAPHRAWGSR